MTAVASEDLGSPLRAFGRSAGYLAITLATIPVQTLAVLFGWPLQHRVLLWYHRNCCRLLGVQVECRGTLSKSRPTLFVCNHCSYIDIPVLGSIIQGSFVAKAEIASWPFFGTLARLQRSVFIDRQAFRTDQHKNALKARLEAGDSLILFPEGTSSDGNRVLPFKSSLLSVAELEPRDRPLTVQPVSLAYTMLDGLPLGRYLRPFIAWYGEMDMASHLWRWAGLGRVTVVVQFHQPVTLSQFGDRKALSEHCQRVISQGMAAALAGRPRELAHRRSWRKSRQMAPGAGGTA